MSKFQDELFLALADYCRVCKEVMTKGYIASEVEYKATQKLGSLISRAVDVKALELASKYIYQDHADKGTPVSTEDKEASND
jgi:hypothetical protein